MSVLNAFGREQGLLSLRSTCKRPGNVLHTRARRAAHRAEVKNCPEVRRRKALFGVMPQFRRETVPAAGSECH